MEAGGPAAGSPPPEMRCDDPAPHAYIEGHVWWGEAVIHRIELDDGSFTNVVSQGPWFCKGRRAGAWTMIGKNE